MRVSPCALALTGVVSDCVPAHRFHTRFSLAARYLKTNNIGVIPCHVSEQPTKCENLALSSVFCTLFASIFPLHVEATAPGPLLLYPVSFPSCSSLSCYFFPFFSICLLKYEIKLSWPMETFAMVIPLSDMTFIPFIKPVLLLLGEKEA